MTFRILDLFCGSGAVSVGLTRAGFDVVGVDLAAMPNYPGAFLRHDALTLDMRFIRSFDAIWASPPCQAHTALRTAKHAKPHADLIPATRALLKASGLPHVIENVAGARRSLINPTCLCGSMFGLGVTVDGQRFQLQRHRLFEASFPLTAPPCRHTTPVIGVYGGHVRQRGARHGGRGTADFIGQDKPALAREAMGITWPTTMVEISQAVPPAYSEHIGRQLIAHLEQARAAA